MPRPSKRKRPSSPHASEVKDYCVYILCCADDTLYTGIAKDFEKRFTAHQQGRGAKYTRSRLPLRLVYLKKGFSKSQALKREFKIKALSREQKLELIKATFLRPKTSSKVANKFPKPKLKLHQK